MPNRISVLGRFTLIAGLFVLAGCVPVYQVAKPDAETGLLPTTVEVKPEEIKIYQPSPVVQRVRFVLLRTASGGINTEPYNEFVFDALRELGITEIMSRDEFMRMVIDSPLRDTVGNATDPVALSKINDAVGPFIIVDAVQLHAGGAWFETRLRVTDPARADVLLDVHRLRINWSNMDKEVNYPVLNVLKRWFDESKALPDEPTAQGESLPKADV
jgi:hypothetical protein